MLRELDAAEFSHDDVAGAEATPVLFEAAWCGFCRRIGPHYRRRAEASERTFLTVDISDEESPVWDAYAIRVVPTVAVFREGKLVARRGGVLGPDDLDAVLEEAGL